MTVQLFADESKRNGFVLIAAAYPAADVSWHRSQLRRQLRAGQRRIHFKSESPQARQRLLTTLATRPPQVHVFISELRSMSQARADCLYALALLASHGGANRLVIEADESRDHDDRRVLTEAMSKAGRHVPWELLPPHVEPLLWVADALAWCWPHPDQRWRQQIQPWVASVTQV